MYKNILDFLNLKQSDVVSVLKGAVVAGIGAAITVFASFITHHDFGPIATPIITAIAGVIVNASRKSADGPVLKATGVQL